MEETVKILFRKYLNNECSSAEIIQLLEFFGIEDNEQLLKSFIYSELENEAEEEDSAITDIDQRLQVVYSRLQEHVGETDPPRVVPIRINWLRIAAAAVIFITVCSGIVYLIPKRAINHSDSRIADHMIKPGKNQAILRLADGREINLSDLKEGEIATQSGVSITKAANGQLVYQDVNEGDENDELQYNSIEAPAGGQWQVVLPDKSHVWLNSKSTLRYPTRFKGSERMVELKGEAYFEISPDQSKPFKVMSKGQTIEVLGTHFNVMSYPDDASEKTTLFEGSVKVSLPGNAKVLKPGEQALVRGASLQVDQHPDLEEVIAWKNGYFKFNGKLEDIMSKISRWYDVEVVYLHKPDDTYNFEGEISRSKDLNEILKIMEYTGKVHFSIKERKIEVSN